MSLYNLLGDKKQRRSKMSFDDLEIKLALDFATRSLTKREIAVLEERTNLGMFAEIDIDEDFAYAVKKSLPVGSITVDEIYDTLSS